MGKNKKFYVVDKKDLPNLETCSHEIGSAGPGLEDYSQWSMIRTLKIMPRKFTEEEFQNELQESVLLEMLLNLSNAGRLEFLWDSECSAIVFNIAKEDLLEEVKDFSPAKPKTKKKQKPESPKKNLPKKRGRPKKNNKDNA